jgi:hypothetical protein
MSRIMVNLHKDTCTLTLWIKMKTNSCVQKLLTWSLVVSWYNGKECDRVSQASKENKIWCFRSAFWIITSSDIHSKYLKITAFHS